MLRQLSDLTRLAVLILLVALVAAWIGFLVLPQAGPRAVTGPDGWGQPAAGWWCWDDGSPAPHPWDAPAGDHVCTQAQVANASHAPATP